jgi:hypothetical protein
MLSDSIDIPTVAREIERRRSRLITAATGPALVITPLDRSDILKNKDDRETPKRPADASRHDGGAGSGAITLWLSRLRLVLRPSVSALQGV